MVALILGVLVDPQAIYPVVEFYQPFDCEVLFEAEGIPPISPMTHWGGP